MYEKLLSLMTGDEIGRQIVPSDRIIPFICGDDTDIVI